METSMRYHLAPVRPAHMTKNEKINSVGVDVGKGMASTAGGMSALPPLWGKNEQEIQLLVTQPKTPKTVFRKDLYTNFTSLFSYQI